MTKFCAFVAVLSLTPIIVGAQQPPGPTIDGALVVTAGHAVVEAVPDRAWVSITAESRASSPREAQNRNAGAMKPVHDKLRAAGVPADAIRTTFYDLQQEWDYVDGRRVSRGYVARNSIEVRVDEIDRVGEFLELAVGSGATSVGGVRFGLKDRARLERDALRLAVADARARAEAAAAGAGRTIDRVVRIEEHGVVSPPIPMPRVALQEAAQVAAAPPISPGQLELRANVTLTAVLK